MEFWLAHYPFISGQVLHLFARVVGELVDVVLLFLLVAAEVVEVAIALAELSLVDVLTGRLAHQCADNVFDLGCYKIRDHTKFKISGSSIKFKPLLMEAGGLPRLQLQAFALARCQASNIW